MVLGTRGRYAGSRRRSDGGEFLISYSLYLSPSTHNGARDQGAVLEVGGAAKFTTGCLTLQSKTCMRSFRRIAERAGVGFVN